MDNYNTTHSNKPFYPIIKATIKDVFLGLNGVEWYEKISDKEHINSILRSLVALLQLIGAAYKLLLPLKKSYPEIPLLGDYNDLVSKIIQESIVEVLLPALNNKKDEINQINDTNGNFQGVINKLLKEQSNSLNSTLISKVEAIVDLNLTLRWGSQHIVQPATAF